jgi:hypothetical protein
LKKKTIIQQEADDTLCVLSGVVFNLEDGGSACFKNVSELIPD